MMVFLSCFDSFVIFFVPFPTKMSDTGCVSFLTQYFHFSSDSYSRGTYDAWVCSNFFVGLYLTLKLFTNFHSRTSVFLMMFSFTGPVPPKYRMLKSLCPNSGIFKVDYAYPIHNILWYPALLFTLNYTLTHKSLLARDKQ